MIGIAETWDTRVHDICFQSATALAQALRTRTIYAAGIDVFEQEPVSADDPLLRLDNVVLAPHIASASIPTRTRMATLAAENIAAVLHGRRPPTPVNPEVLAQ